MSSPGKISVFCFSCFSFFLTCLSFSLLHHQSMRKLMIGFVLTLCVTFFCFSVIPPCNLPTTVENADITENQPAVYNHGETVTYACRTNYRMDGERTITCQSGQWSPRTPICISKCFFLMALHTNLGFLALRQLRW